MIAIGADHAGYTLKEAIKQFLVDRDIAFKDFGTFDETSVDYPDISEQVARYVSKEHGQGILICGTGIGSSIAANKVHGIRAALCHNEFTAEMARKHNDANILVLGGRVLETSLALKLVEIFLSTQFEGGRHERRVNKTMAVETRSK